MKTARDLAFETKFARDVSDGLRAPQKILPTQYLYDAIGSVLFEAITLLPEYGLTRAEERLLQAHAAEICRSVAPVAAVVELGSGSGRKTRQILNAMRKHQAEVNYFPIDVSQTALQQCCEHVKDVRGVKAYAVQASYLDGLAKVREETAAGGRLLLLFLGSTIGNFPESEMSWFLKRVREDLRPGDAFLLGTDLVKAPQRLLDAYDDPLGITAAFNLNLLARINRELGGNFQLQKFQHQARWIVDKNRIEMHLVSRERQFVGVPAANCRVSFEPGESIWTESSRKFTTADLQKAALQAGFSASGQWIDQEWPFAENLWMVE